VARHRGGMTTTQFDRELVVECSLGAGGRTTLSGQGQDMVVAGPARHMETRRGRWVSACACLASAAVAVGAGSSASVSVSGPSLNSVVHAPTWTAGLSMPGSDSGLRSPPAAGPIPSCAGRDLAVTVVDMTSPGSDVRSVVRFRNRGVAACILRGHPSVTIVANRRRRGDTCVTLPVVDVARSLIRSVTLPTGQLASSTVEWEQITSSTSASCCATALTDVTPPGTRDGSRVQLSRPPSGCLGLEVYPVVSGDQGVEGTSEPHHFMVARPAGAMSGPGRW
jgi:hypothetical protein